MINKITRVCIYENGAELSAIMRTVGIQEQSRIRSEFQSMQQRYWAQELQRNVLSVDPTCLREVINAVSVFQDGFNDASDICQKQTISLELNSELRNAFDAIEVVATSQEENGMTAGLAEYLDTTPSSYESVCQGNGGTHVQLNLQAVCRGWKIASASAGVVEEYDAKFVVGNRPRCYGVGCTPSDDVGLLEQFTLRETERKWEMKIPNTFWVCQGKLVNTEDQSDFGVCAAETAAIGEVSVVDSTNNAILPEVNNRKETSFFFFSKDVKDEYVATFKTSTSETAAYESKCTETGGSFSTVNGFSTVNDLAVQCVGISITAEVYQTMKFEASDFPVCLGSSCTTLEETEDVETALMTKKLEMASSLGHFPYLRDFKCSRATMSGAFSSFPLPTIISLVVMVGGSMWFL